MWIGGTSAAFAYPLYPDVHVHVVHVGIPIGYPDTGYRVRRCLAGWLTGCAAAAHNREGSTDPGAGMLYADKQQLETDLKVSLLQIRERELDLYTSNFRNIGIMAALIGGFAYNGCFSAINAVSHDDSVRAFYLFVTTCAMGLNVCSTFVSVTSCMFGPGLALRGPDGSMDQAVEGLALEYRSCLMVFFIGLEIASGAGLLALAVTTEIRFPV